MTHLYSLCLFFIQLNSGLYRIPFLYILTKILVKWVIGFPSFEKKFRDFVTFIKTIYLRFIRRIILGICWTIQLNFLWLDTKDWFLKIVTFKLSPNSRKFEPSLTIWRNLRMLRTVRGKIRDVYIIGFLRRVIVIPIYK